MGVGPGAKDDVGRILQTRMYIIRTNTRIKTDVFRRDDAADDDEAMRIEW
jgi:hypothetical protein